jgi:predicted nucleic acid-binding protein
MFTIDASVHINAVNPTEIGSAESRAFLKQLREQPRPMFSPTLLLVEVATSVARAKNDANRGVAIARAIYGRPGQVWVPLDGALAEEAARLGAEYRLRGADAVYVAVAKRYGATLVTRDRQQLERLPSAVMVLTPTEALTRLAKLAKADKRRK